MRSFLLALAALTCLAGCTPDLDPFSSSYAPPTGRAVRNWPPSNSQSMPSSVNSLPAGATARY